MTLEEARKASRERIAEAKKGLDAARKSGIPARIAEAERQLDAAMENFVA